MTFRYTLSLHLKLIYEYAFNEFTRKSASTSLLRRVMFNVSAVDARHLPKLQDSGLSFLID